MKEVLTLFDKDRLIKLHIQGHSNSFIAKELMISRPTVIKYVKQYKKDQHELNHVNTHDERNEIILRSSSVPNKSQTL